MVDWHMVGRLDDFPPDRLVPKTIGSANIILVRRGDDVVALRDRCPHRFVPLSLGKVVDGEIHCPYHGLRFALDGHCVLNPHGDGVIPPAAKVPSFAVEQRDGQIFVGMN